MFVGLAILAQVVLGSCGLVGGPAAHAGEGSTHGHHSSGHHPSAQPATGHHPSGAACDHDTPAPDAPEAAATDPRRPGDGPAPGEAVPSVVPVSVSPSVGTDAGGAPVCGTRGPPLAGRALLDTIGIART